VKLKVIEVKITTMKQKVDQYRLKMDVPKARCAELDKFEVSDAVWNAQTLASYEVLDISKGMENLLSKLKSTERERISLVADQYKIYTGLLSRF